jgi:hypothetical protein
MNPVDEGGHPGSNGCDCGLNMDVVMLKASKYCLTHVRIARACGMPSNLWLMIRLIREHNRETVHLRHEAWW